MAKFPLDMHLIEEGNPEFEDRGPTPEAYSRDADIIGKLLYEEGLSSKMPVYNSFEPFDPDRPVHEKFAPGFVDKTDSNVYREMMMEIQRDMERIARENYDKREFRKRHGLYWPNDEYLDVPSREGRRDRTYWGTPDQGGDEDDD